VWRVTWKGLAGHKLRLVLTLLAIALGVGLVAGSYVFTDTLTKVFDDLFADSFAGIDVQVRSVTDEDLGFALPERLDEDLVDTVAGVDGVETAIGNVAGLVTLVGPDGEVVGGQGPPTLGGSWSPVASPLTVRAGEPPDEPGEIGIDVATAERASIELGDRVQVVGSGGPEPFTVVALLGFGGSDSFGGATFVAWEFETAQRLLDAQGEVDAISVVADPGIEPEALIDHIDPILPDGVEAVTAQTAAEDQLATFKEALGFLNTFLLVFGFVALFVGAFLIQNTFQIMIAQRTRELALLRAVGASRQQVFGMVLGEAGILSGVASLVGVMFGVGLAAVIRLGFESFGGDLPTTTLQVRPRTVLVAVGAGLAVTLASALVPARKASAVAPLAAMRSAYARPGRRGLRRRAGAGALVIATGAGVGALGLAGVTDDGRIPPIALVGVGAGLAFIGLAVLAPTFARPLGRTLGAPLPAVFGATGRMARENAVRSPRRTAATASAVMIGVALVGLVTIIASTIRATTDALVADRFRSNLVVQTSGFGGAGLSPELADRLETLDAVGSVTRIRRGPVKIGDELSFAAAADMATIEDNVRFDVLGGSFDDVGANAIAVSDEAAATYGWSLGSTAEVTFGRTGTVALRVAAVYAAEGPGADLYMSLETWNANFIERNDATVFVSFADGVDEDAARAEVEAVADGFPGSAVLDQTEFRDQAVSQLDAFVLLVYALLTLALVIGFVGIANTLLLSVYERTREIGLLRAVGTTRRQIRRMVTWEAVIIATFGAVVGTAVGLLFGWAIVIALGDQAELVFRIPVGRLALAVGAAALAGVLAAIYPARRASRLDVLRAIAYE
jgi:putative ABC transport system permease protein